MTAPLTQKLGLDSIAFEGLEHRARVPAMLRDLVERGAVEVSLTMSAKTALRMADDLEYAVSERPLGIRGEPT